MKRKITIKDVALEADVSVSTVSRVINKNYTVNSSLANKVEMAIKKLNYYPNNAARSLKTQSTGTIAFLVSNISDYFFTKLGKGIEEIVREQGYNVIFCSTNNCEKTERSYLSILQEKHVDGIVLNTTGQNDQLITDLSHNMPLVLSNRKIYNSNFKGDFVDFDNISGISELTNHLISYGHKKIGVVNGPQYISTFSERYEGFSLSMNSIDVDTTKNYKYHYTGNGSSSYEDGYNGVKYLMEKKDKPSAIIMMNTEMAFGGLKYCISHNIKIPENLSFVAFGDMLHKDLLYINPTISFTNLNGIGRKVAELILDRIKTKNKAVNREVRFTTNLHHGNSIKNIL